MAPQTHATAGYTGAKGIGFKSVFALSARPEVHSAGYSVRFDLERWEEGVCMRVGQPASFGLRQIRAWADLPI
jgi:hypothetical protein